MKILKRKGQQPVASWYIWRLAVIFIGLCLCINSVHAQFDPEHIRAVDARATGNNDGTSWENAYTFLQDALAFASVPQNGITEIWVAKGVYVPDRNSDHPFGSGDRDATFLLDFNNITILGGFIGTEDDHNDRNPALNETVLSGLLKAGPRAFNVVTAIGTDDSVRIDGFTITKGLADEGGFPFGVGSGMYIFNASPAVVRVLFTENEAPEHGGAMHIGGDSLPTLVNTSFINNSGDEAGAIHTEGGMSGGTFVNCLFIRNASQREGGAINPGGSALHMFINCTFADNSVATSGAGAIAWEGSPVILTSCILWGNLAGGSPSQLAGEFTVNYSDIEGGWDGIENIDEDPLFLDAENGNYRLQPGSPCFDKGDPYEKVIPLDTFDVDQDTNEKERTPDLDLLKRIVNEFVDMGVYESAYCPLDLDSSGSVGTSDLLTLLAQWGSDGSADFDENGVVGTSDLLVLLANWGPCNNLDLPCGNAEAGPCFFANETPGCEDEECCSAVCAIDPSCCLIQWDQQCADQALTTCSDPNCPGVGNCWESNGTPGCNDALCCNIVCEIDPSCCVIEWDQQCVEQAMPICSAPNCPGEGNCSESNGTPGCNDEFCCNIICEIDPLCCYVDWDLNCANAASELCPACGNAVSGSCFKANPTPFCDDKECCELVCSEDSACCEIEWDEICAAFALKICNP